MKEHFREKRFLMMLGIGVLILGVMAGFGIKKFSNKDAVAVVQQEQRQESNAQTLMPSQQSQFPPLPTDLPVVSQRVFNAVPTGNVSNTEGHSAKLPNLPIPNMPGNMPKPMFPGTGKDTKQNVGVNAIVYGDENIAILSDGTVVQAGSSTKWGTVESIGDSGVMVGNKYIALDRSMPAAENISFQNQENNFMPQSITNQDNLPVLQKEVKEELKKDMDSSDIKVPEIMTDDKMTFGGKSK